MKKHFLYPAFYLLIFFFTSCKKDKKDTSPPLISITSPTTGQSFNMFDTIPVTAHISDETHLTSVAVGIVDLNNIPAQGNYAVPVQSNDFTFSIKYILTQFHLSSGFYNLSITANDGTNSGQATVKIYITESPTIKLGYYIVGATQPKNVVRYDTTMAQKNVITLNTGFNGMVYGAYDQQLYINGNTYQSLQAVDPVYNDQLCWTAPYNVNSWFTCISTDTKKAYVGYYGSKVYSYNSTGGFSTQYITSDNSYYPVYFTTTSTYGVGVYKAKIGAQYKIISFGLNTGIAINNNFMPCSISQIFEHTQDELYVLGNDSANQAVLYLYSVSGNNFSGPFSLPAGKLLSASQVNSDYLIFSSGNGNIYGYQYSVSNITALANITAQKIFFQPKMNELTASAKNNLYTYKLSTNYSLTLSNMRVLTDSIIGFEVVTNK